MPKLATLKNRADFLRIQGTGVKWVAKGVMLQAAGGQTDGVRYGLTVSKKLEKSAVRRNRIRRRLRAAALAVLAAQARPGADYVLTGRPGTAQRPFADLCRDLAWCLEKTGFAK